HLQLTPDHQYGERVFGPRPVAWRWVVAAGVVAVVLAATELAMMAGRGRRVRGPGPAPRAAPTTRRCRCPRAAPARGTDGHPDAGRGRGASSSPSTGGSTAPYPPLVLRAPRDFGIVAFAMCSGELGWPIRFLRRS